MHRGVLSAGLAFLLWGLFPLYFHALGRVPAVQILAHRVLWAVVFLAIVLGVRHQWAWLGGLRGKPRVLFGFLATSALLSGNWLLYIWAVQSGHVIDASLGYFINPLVNVMLGFLVLQERLRPLQWTAVGLAAAGVLWLTWQAGHMPWIALLLAFSFGAYGLLRKTAALGPLEGLALETALMLPFALGFLAWLSAHGQNVFVDATVSEQILLVALGPVTAIPLLLFATGARSIPLSVLGLLQYIGPTIQLALGILVFHEPFSGARLAGFAIIWSALALYALEGLLRRRA